MRALPSLLAILLLLLPSGLSAALAAEASCAAMEALAEMSCCCSEHSAPTEENGPAFSSECCCELNSPLAPPSNQEGARFAPEEKTSSTLQVCPFEEITFFCSSCSRVNEAVSVGPPRAPPRPLYLSFQSFLI